MMPFKKILALSTFATFSILPSHAQNAGGEHGSGPAGPEIQAIMAYRKSAPVIQAIQNLKTMGYTESSVNTGTITPEQVTRLSSQCQKHENSKSSFVTCDQVYLIITTFKPPKDEGFRTVSGLAIMNGNGSFFKFIPELDLNTATADILRKYPAPEPFNSLSLGEL